MKNSRKAKVRSGSLKYWHNPSNNTVWASAEVHAGRVTRVIRGREARDPSVAVELLQSALNQENE